jgi:hypothetical protein
MQLKNICRRGLALCMDGPSTKESLPGALRFASITALLSLLVRIPLALSAPVISPDGRSYLTVARNIFENGCVSLSLPASGLCVPHWGGNHLPGYPAFASLFAADTVSLLMAQIVVFSAACSYFVFVLHRYFGIPLVSLGVGVVLAVSPLQIGWGRFVLPDLLSNALLLFTFTEILQSVRFGTLRWFSLGLAVSASVFVRYDGLLLVIPIAVAGFYLHGFKGAVWRGMLVAAVLSAPLAGWWARSVSAGLGFMPEQRFMYDGSYRPSGYLTWVRSWSKDLYQAANAGYPVANKNYSRIIVAENAWDNEAEKQLVEELLFQLVAYESQDFPGNLDKEFEILAAQRISARPIRQYIFLPAHRAVAFWMNPYYSFGLPGIELGEKMSDAERWKFSTGGIVEKVNVAFSYPVAALGKAGLFFYRLLIFLGFILLFFAIALTSSRKNRVLIATVLSFSVFKVVSLSFQESVDSRYLIGVFALLEVSIVLMAGAFFHRRQLLAS